MKNAPSVLVLLTFLIGNCFGSFGQQNLNIQPLSQQEIEQLSIAEGCGCYLSDLNYYNDKVYLYGDGDLGDPNNPIVPHLYLKINNQIIQFAYASEQYSMSFTGEPEPVFDLYFNKTPNETDIKNAIKAYGNWENITKDKNHKDYWLINGEWPIRQHEIDQYHLFTSKDFDLRLYEYKQGNDVESTYTKGEISIFKKGNDWPEQNLVFVLRCGC